MRDKHYLTDILSQLMVIVFLFISANLAILQWIPMNILEVEDDDKSFVVSELIMWESVDSPIAKLLFFKPTSGPSKPSLSHFIPPLEIITADLLSEIFRALKI